MTEQIWGIHNDTLTHELVDRGFISIGWDGLGDLTQILRGREGLKKALTTLEPEAKVQSIAGQAGVLFRFAHEIRVGDIVVAPYKPDSTINIGIVDSDYYFDADAPTHRHRHRVQWVKTGLPRAVFSQSALYELGSALTLFQVKRHTAEVRTAMAADTDDADAIADTMDTLATTASNDLDDQEAEQPRASRIERHTRDFILEVLSNRISPVTSRNCPPTCSESSNTRPGSPSTPRTAAWMSSRTRTPSASNLH